MLPAPILAIRTAHVSERAALREFQIENHLNASVYSPESRQAQIDDLEVDFPQLYSDDVFLTTTQFVIALAPAGGGAGDSACTYVGLVGVATDHKDATGKTAELQNFSVAPSHRRAGLGQQLLTHALNFAAARGYTSIRLITLKDVMAGACRLYARNGFVEYDSLVTPFYHVLYLRRSLLPHAIVAPVSDSAPASAAVLPAP